VSIAPRPADVITRWALLSSVSLVIEHQDQPSWTLEYADDTSDHAGSLFSEPEDDRDQMAPDSDMPKPVVTNENPVQTGGKGRSRVIEHWTALLNESTEDRTVSSEDEDEIEDEGVPNEQETRSQSSDIEQEGEEMEVDVPWDQMPSYKSCQSEPRISLSKHRNLTPWRFL